MSNIHSLSNIFFTFWLCFSVCLCLCSWHETAMIYSWRPKMWSPEVPTVVAVKLESLSLTHTHTLSHHWGLSCCGVVKSRLVKYSTGFDTSPSSIHPCAWKKTSHTLWERDWIEFTLPSLGKHYCMSWAWHKQTHTHTQIWGTRHIAWIDMM